MSQTAGSVIVTDAALRTALYTIRSLGRRGVRITAVERAGSGDSNLGALSRYVTRREAVPDNHTDPAGFADALLQLAPGHDVLFPIGMHSVLAVASRAGEFHDHIGLALAPFDTIALADDTRRLLELARELGIPQPRRFRLADFAGTDALVRELPLPAIIKTGIEAGLPPRDRYAVVRTPDEVRAALDRLSRVTQDLIIQELVEGDGIGVEMLYDFDGRPVATFCHRRLREYPLTGGPSTYCESIRHPVAEFHARTLLDHLRWTGLAMVEFKIDARTGEPKLMEINPRPWGSMALPIAAGTDFPWLAFQLARDRSLTPQPESRAGVRLRFLITDLQAALAQSRAASSIGGQLSPFLSLLDPRVHEGVLKLGDPRPSYAYLRKAFRALRAGADPF